MSENMDRKIGRLFIHDGPHGLQTLHAAQAGCVVLECIHRSWKSGWDMVILHDELDWVEPAKLMPHYDAEIVCTTDPETRKQTYHRERFVRLD